MRILLAMDGSVCSERALHYVYRHFAAETIEVATVIPLHIPLEPLGLGWGSGATAVVADRVDHEIAQQTLNTAQVALRSVPATKFRVVEGAPGPTIVHIAEELASDVIVVGSHGRGAIARLLLGSVATYVVHHAGCPVLVVRGDRQT